MLPRSSLISFNISSSVDVGLRILTAETSLTNSNVVINAGLKFIKPVFRLNQTHPSYTSSDACFLKSCFLCTKTLSLDKDVYMYRGNQGFCSEKCRSRQMYLDEMIEIDMSTRQTLASFRRCRDSYRCETRSLLEEFQHRQGQPKSCQNGRAPVFTLS